MTCRMPCDQDCTAECHQEHMPVWERYPGLCSCMKVQFNASAWLRWRMPKAWRDAVQRRKRDKRLYDWPTCPNVKAEYHRRRR